ATGATGAGRMQERGWEAVAHGSHATVVPAVAGGVLQTRARPVTRAAGTVVAHELPPARAQAAIARRRRAAARTAARFAARTQRSSSWGGSACTTSATMPAAVVLRQEARSAVGAQDPQANRPHRPGGGTGQARRSRLRSGRDTGGAGQPEVHAASR